MVDISLILGVGHQATPELVARNDLAERLIPAQRALPQSRTSAVSNPACGHEN